MAEMAHPESDILSTGTLDELGPGRGSVGLSVARTTDMTGMGISAVMMSVAMAGLAETAESMAVAFAASEASPAQLS